MSSPDRSCANERMPDSVGHPALVAHVDVGCRIVADEHDREAGRRLAGRNARGDPAADFVRQAQGARLAIDDAGGHLFSIRA